MSIFVGQPTFYRPGFFNDATSTPRTTGSPPLGIAKRMENSENDKCSNLNMSEKQYSTTMKEVGMKNMEKMDCAYSTLLKEMDRVQKWQTNIELECKNKDRKIQELTQNSESQRKIILDYQLKNESLSLQIHEEMQQRNEVMQKFASTRDMCTALKKYFDTLQEKFKYCCETKDAIDNADNERRKSIENLANKFENLHFKTTEQIADLKNALTEETNKSMELTDVLNKQHAESEEQLETLEKGLQTIQHENNRLCKDLKEKMEHISHLTVEKDELLLKVNLLSSKNEESMKQLEDLDSKFKELQNSKNEIESKYSSAYNLVLELKATCEKKEESLNILTKTSQENYAALNKTIANSELALDSEIKKFKEKKSRCEALISKINEVQQEKDDFETNATRALNEMERQMKADNENFGMKLRTIIEEKNVNTHELLEARRQIFENENLISSLNTQYEEGQSIIASVTKEVSDLQEKLGLLNMEKEAQMEREKELEREVIQLQSTCLEISLEKEGLEKRLNQIELDYKNRVDSSDMKDVIIENFKAECTSLQQDLIKKDSITEGLNADCSHLREELHEKCEINLSLEVEHSKLWEELSERVKMYENLKAEYSELQENLSDKSSIIENLQSELNELQVSFSSKCDIVENLNVDNKMIEVLEDEHNALQQVVSEKSGVIESLKCEHEELKKELNKKLKVIENLRTDSDKLLTDLKEKDETIKALRKEQSDLHDKLCVEIEKSKNCIRCELMKAENTSFTKELSEKKHQLEIFEAELQQQSQLLKKNEITEQKLRNCASELMKMLNEAQEGNSAHLYEKQMENSKLMYKISILEDQLNFGDSKVVEFNGLKEKVGEYETLIEGMKEERATELKKLQHENNKLKRALETIKNNKKLQVTDFKYSSANNAQAVQTSRKSKKQIHQELVTKSFLKKKPVANANSPGSDCIDIEEFIKLGTPKADKNIKNLQMTATPQQSALRRSGRNIPVVTKLETLKDSTNDTDSLLSEDTVINEEIDTAQSIPTLNKTYISSDKPTSQKLSLNRKGNALSTISETEIAKAAVSKLGAESSSDIAAVELPDKSSNAKGGSSSTSSEIMIVKEVNNSPASATQKEKNMNSSRIATPQGFHLKRSRLNTPNAETGEVKNIAQVIPQIEKNVNSRIATPQEFALNRNKISTPIVEMKALKTPRINMYDIDSSGSEYMDVEELKNATPIRQPSVIRKSPLSAAFQSGVLNRAKRNMPAVSKTELAKSPRKCDMDSSVSDCMDVEDLKLAVEHTPQLEKGLLKPLKSSPQQHFGLNKIKRSVPDTSDTWKGRMFLSNKPASSFTNPCYQPKRQCLDQATSRVRDIISTPVVSSPGGNKFFKTRVPGKDKIKPFSWF